MSLAAGVLDTRLGTSTSNCSLMNAREFRFGFAVSNLNKIVRLLAKIVYGDAML
jgi:hypothetical protein